MEGKWKNANWPDYPYSWPHWSNWTGRPSESLQASSQHTAVGLYLDTRRSETFWQLPAETPSRWTIPTSLTLEQLWRGNDKGERKTEDKIAATTPRGRCVEDEKGTYTPNFISKQTNKQTTTKLQTKTKNWVSWVIVCWIRTMFLQCLYETPSTVKGALTSTSVRFVVWPWAVWLCTTHVESFSASKSYNKSEKNSLKKNL